MEIRFSARFRKQYQKSNSKVKTAFNKRLQLFKEDIFNPTLNNHPLMGKYRGYRSINITGDQRAIYKKEYSMVTFVALGSHSNLYG